MRIVEIIDAQVIGAPDDRTGGLPVDQGKPASRLTDNGQFDAGLAERAHRDVAGRGFGSGESGCGCRPSGSSKQENSTLHAGHITKPDHRGATSNAGLRAMPYG